MSLSTTSAANNILSAAAVYIFKQLGPAQTEAVYRKALAHELTETYGWQCYQEVPVPLEFFSSCAIETNKPPLPLGVGFVDICVYVPFDDGYLVYLLELKHIESLREIDSEQVKKYMKATVFHECIVGGYLVNFPKAPDGKTSVKFVQKPDLTF